MMKAEERFTQLVLPDWQPNEEYERGAGSNIEITLGGEWSFGMVIQSETAEKVPSPLEKGGFRVISINEHLDESPSGQLLEGIIESVDEFYSANLGQDIKRGLRENAARGFYSIGRAPYGFRKAPVKDGVKTRYKLEPEPEDSTSVKVVRRIFEMALKRIGCKQIAMTLNREGFFTGTGQR